MVMFSAASAWALGRVFIQHFESGGTFADFSLDEGRELFHLQFAKGQNIAAVLGFRPCTPHCQETGACSNRCRIRKAVLAFAADRDCAAAIVAAKT